MLRRAALRHKVFVRDCDPDELVSRQGIGPAVQFTTERCELNIFELKSSIKKQILGWLFAHGCLSSAAAKSVAIRSTSFGNEWLSLSGICDTPIQAPSICPVIEAFVSVSPPASMTMRSISSNG